MGSASPPQTARRPCRPIAAQWRNGLDALERIREFELYNAHRVPRNALAIMATATSDSQDVVRAYCCCSAYAYLVKPIQAPDVELIMERIAQELSLQPL